MTQSVPPATKDDVLREIRAAIGHLNLAQQALQTANIQQQMAEGRIKGLLESFASQR